MDENAIISYMTGTFDGIDVVEHSGNRFYFYNPDSTLPPDRRLPFVTLVTNDAYDRVSHLNRRSVFRLNIGVSHDSYRAMFGQQPSLPGESGIVDTGHDYATLDQIMPHPVYAAMSWVCVLSPGKVTFEAVKPLLAEAYDIAVRRFEARAKRK